MNGQEVPEHPPLLEADSVEGVVERVYQQMFAVLALERNAMVDVASLDVDQSILNA